MKIYTVCVDPENGKYLAISTTDPTIRWVSHHSALEALGQLVNENPGIDIEQVIEIETSSE